jgi:hypothetical protein
MALDATGSTVAWTRWIGWRRAGIGVLGLAVLSGIVLGPWGALGFVAGLLQSGVLMISFILLGLIGWAILLWLACVHAVRNWRTRRKASALCWSSMACGVVLAFAVGMVGQTPAPIHYFGHGVFQRLTMRTDVNAVQSWVESLHPADCLTGPHSGNKGRHLSEEEQPEVLKAAKGRVDLELDGEGQPCVRLSWYEGKGGTWGLVIGHRNMRTPAPDPRMYGESRMELRPGVYFWYVEG